MRLSREGTPPVLALLSGSPATQAGGFWAPGHLSSMEQGSSLCPQNVAGVRVLRRARRKHTRLLSDRVLFTAMLAHCRLPKDRRPRFHTQADWCLPLTAPAPLWHAHIHLYRCTGHLHAGVSHTLPAYGLPWAPCDLTIYSNYFVFHSNEITLCILLCIFLICLAIQQDFSMEKNVFYFSLGL